MHVSLYEHTAGSYSSKCINCTLAGGVMNVRQAEIEMPDGKQASRLDIYNVRVFVIKKYVRWPFYSYTRRGVQ